MDKNEKQPPRSIPRMPDEFGERTAVHVSGDITEARESLEKQASELGFLNVNGDTTLRDLADQAHESDQEVSLVFESTEEIMERAVVKDEKEIADEFLDSELLKKAQRSEIATGNTKLPSQQFVDHTAVLMGDRIQDTRAAIAGMLDDIENLDKQIKTLQNERRIKHEQKEQFERVEKTLIDASEALLTV